MQTQSSSWGQITVTILVDWEVSAELPDSRRSQTLGEQHRSFVGWERESGGVGLRGGGREASACPPNPSFENTIMPSIVRFRMFAHSISRAQHWRPIWGLNYQKVSSFSWYFHPKSSGQGDSKLGSGIERIGTQCPLSLQVSNLYDKII